MILSDRAMLLYGQQEYILYIIHVQSLAIKPTNLLINFPCVASSQ